MWRKQDDVAVSGDDEQETEDEDSKLLESEVTGVMSKLPVDIVLEILSRVPIKSLCSCKYVSKAWFNAIKNPRFIEMHHNKVIQTNSSSCVMTSHYLFSDQDLELLQSPITAYTPKIPTPHPKLLLAHQMESCNGLVFDRKQHYFISNPITGERLTLPDPPVFDLHDVASGFGFDPVSQAFKVVRVIGIPHGGCNYETMDHLFTLGTPDTFEKMTQLHTVGTTNWRVISGENPVDFRSKSSVFINGALHWVGNLSFSTSGVIISFKLDTEEFQQLPLPPPCQQLSDPTISAIHKPDPYVIALEECLCVVRCSGSTYIEIWKMEEYGVQSSWVRSYVISAIRQGNHLLYGPYNPLQVMKNGKLLLCCEDSLGYYDLLQRNFDPIDITYHDSTVPAFLRKPILGLLLHVGSLISPKSVGRLRRSKRLHGRKYQFIEENMLQEK